MPLCPRRRGPLRLASWLASHLLPATCVGCGGRLLTHQRQGLCLSCWETLEPRAWPACGRCADPTPAPESLCGRCARSAPPYHWAMAVWKYEGAARGAVRAFKYGRIPGLVRPLTQALLALAGERLLARRPILVPVPLHPRRVRERDFDAIQALALGLGRQLGLRVARPLARPREATPQTGLGTRARQRNAALSFRLSRPEQIFGRPAVLLDDVLTTGATAAACTRLLLGGGAREVGVLALARARLD